MYLSALLLIFVGQAVTDAYVYRYAFDATGDVSSNIACLHQYYTAGLFRVFDNGVLNKQGVNNYEAAKKIYADDFLELIVTLKPDADGKQQFAVFNKLFGDGAYHKSVWVDLTDSSKWTGQTDDNYNKIKTFLDEASNNGFFIGVLTNNAANEKIIGSKTYDTAKTRIWYQGDQKLDMCDYRQIGGQTIPTVKQLSPNFSTCGTTVGNNIYIAPYKKAIQFRPTLQKQNRCN